MFIGAAILVGPRTLGLAGSQDGELTATAAAESGMQYALMRIRQDPEWRGNGSGVVLSTSDFTVVEDSGYVWGHMKTANGGGSMFRIRFNFENGPDNGDGLNDSAGLRFLSPYVSLNNLGNSNPGVVPRASDDTQSAVDDPEEGDYVVPAHGICLLVEGIAGPGVREFDSSQPNPKGLVHSKILESTFVVSNLDDLAIDAVAMSNSDLSAKLQPGKKFSVESKGGTPRIRSRGNVSVQQQNGTSGTYDSKGTVYTKDGNLNADYDSKKVTVETEDNSNPFYELTWDELLALPQARCLYLRLVGRRQPPLLRHELRRLCHLGEEPPQHNERRTSCLFGRHLCYRLHASGQPHHQRWKNDHHRRPLHRARQ